MNPNYKPISTTTQMSGIGIDGAKSLIINTIKSNQQTFWPDIKKASELVYSFEELQEAKKQLLRDCVISMREDSCEHDWEWVLVK